MDPDAMSPCFRGCGAWVKTSGPAVCSACQVGPERPAARLHTTERRVGPYVVRTRGFSVVLEALVPPDHGMFALDAHVLSVALQEAADYVEAMRTPYEAPERVPNRRTGVVDDPYGHEEDR